MCLLFLGWCREDISMSIRLLFSCNGIKISIVNTYQEIKSSRSNQRLREAV
ncbi:hypothetical protein HanRHA438_Chr08g0361371 [Helianthus annuus]|nr:hypothetical protein HanRHA438_Chr08g0361371 [Helianthus annuus]